MSLLRKELVFLIRQFLDEEGFPQTVRTLERESGLYFDMLYFEDKVLNGNWDEAERYLSGFTDVRDNRYSIKIFFEIRKQKFLEALDNKDRASALDILRKDMKVFNEGHEQLLKDMANLLTLNDIREHESLAMYGDAKSMRQTMLQEIKKVIEANPCFLGKLDFPEIVRQRLRRLVNQSLNWQHTLCEEPNQNPAIATLFSDHVCLPESDGAISQSISYGSLSGTPPVKGPSSQSTITDTTFFVEAPRNQASCTNVLRGSHNIAEEEGLRTAHDEALSDPDNMPRRNAFTTAVKAPMSFSFAGQDDRSEDLTISNLPKTVVQTLNESSRPISMSFHPVCNTALLVGTNTGEFGVWDISCNMKLCSICFKVWNIQACSKAFMDALVKDSHVSVTNIMWSPDGSLFGVAFSKHIAQLYIYHGSRYIKRHLEIDAHEGSVNDLAFSCPVEQLFLITCGDDKKIKVWDVVTGNPCYCFEGHGAPVYSVCPHKKDNIHFIFSTSRDGKIKVWLYDTLGARINYNAPGLGCTKMAYSDRAQRLFSCGTGKDGQSYLVEWDESEGYVKRNYKGLKSYCLSAIAFSTIKDHFLAVGDDHRIKFWQMDNVDLLTTTDAGGGLLENPYICFNKDGSLLAVTADENKIKILAPSFPVWMQKMTKTFADVLGDASKQFKQLSEKPTSHGSVAEGAHMHGKIGETNIELTREENVCNHLEINKPSQCQLLQLPLHVEVEKVQIVRLTYTNAGNGLLALASNAIHVLWKWPANDKATAKVLPQIWHPRSGSQLMRNDLDTSNPVGAVSSFALSRNDSYLISASGGQISLFNTFTFKPMMKMMPPPPKATSLAFCPRDNNLVAIGMENSSIVIFNVRANEVTSKLFGHINKITGLAFSRTSNVLLSADASTNLCLWDANDWGKQKQVRLQIGGAEMTGSPVNLHVQFHPDQIHFLVAYESKLAIYEADELQCIKQRVQGEDCASTSQFQPRDYAMITHATFSCDGKMVYASFTDGKIAMYNASNLMLQCQINPSAYIPPQPRISVYPVAVAAHPQKPTQLAAGLSDGRVFVFEPQEDEGEWRMVSPAD